MAIVVAIGESCDAPLQPSESLQYSQNPSQFESLLVTMHEVCAPESQLAQYRLT